MKKKILHIAYLRYAVQNNKKLYSKILLLMLQKHFHHLLGRYSGL